MAKTAFKPFDPARVSVRSNRLSTTQGTFTIVVDGKDALTLHDPVTRRPVDPLDPSSAREWLGYTEAQKLATAKRLWERGNPRSRIEPLSGAAPFLSVDSDDVLRLPNVDGRDLFAHFDMISSVVDIYDMSDGPTDSGDGSFLKSISMRDPAGEWSAFANVHGDRNDDVFVVQAYPEINLGSIEMFACKRFAQKLHAQRELDLLYPIAVCMPQDEFKQIEQANIAEVRFGSAEIRALTDYMANRGKSIEVREAYGRCTDASGGIAQVAFAGTTGAFVVCADASPRDIVRNWACDDDIRSYINPVWLGTLTDTDLDFNADIDPQSIMVYPAMYFDDGSVKDVGIVRPEGEADPCPEDIAEFSPTA